MLSNCLLGSALVPRPGVNLESLKDFFFPSGKEESLGGPGSQIAGGGRKTQQSNFKCFAGASVIMF